MAESVASEEPTDLEGPLGEEAEDAGADGVAGPGADGAGLALLDVEAVARCSVTFGKMRALFRVTTGLDVFLFVRDSSTGAWKEEGFTGPIQMPHFCRLVRSTPQGLACCTASHRDMMEQAVRHPDHVCQRCHANLMSFHVPVSIRGNGLAGIQTGGTVDQGARSGDSPRLYEKIAGLGLSERQMLEAIDSLPVVSTASIARVAEWLELLASYLAETSGPAPAPGPRGEPAAKAKAPVTPYAVQQQVREAIGRYVVLPTVQSDRSCGCSASVVERVAAFLDGHCHLPLSTQLIAWALGFEPSYFGKMFKRRKSISLPQYVRRVRLSRAKRLLEDPYITIVEIAERTGFSDASYFTRVFHRAFGVTPSQFRAITVDTL